MWRYLHKNSFNIQKKKCTTFQIYVHQYKSSPGLAYEASFINNICRSSKSKLKICNSKSKTNFFIQELKFILQLIVLYDQQSKSYN